MRLVEMKREIRVEPWQLLRSSPSIRSSRYHLDTHRLSGWIKLLFNLSGSFPSQSLESIGLSFNNSFKTVLTYFSSAWNRLGQREEGMELCDELRTGSADSSRDRVRVRTSSFPLPLPSSSFHFGRLPHLSLQLCLFYFEGGSSPGVASCCSFL